MNDMGNVRPLGIRCNHKIHEYSCCIDLGSVHARFLARAHTSTGRFLHNPGHECICKSVRSGQNCMVVTIASDTGCPWVCGLIYETSNFFLGRPILWRICGYNLQCMVVPKKVINSMETCVVEFFLDSSELRINGLTFCLRDKYRSKLWPVAVVINIMFG